MSLVQEQQYKVTLGLHCLISTNYVIGYVVVKCNQPPASASQLRLIFKGVETLLAYDIGPGMFRTHTYDLFKISSTLWKKDTDPALTAGETHRFLFTIQMPMIQYPPTFQHNLYKCYYMLIAYFEPAGGGGEFPVMTQKQIRYIPLTETRPLKTQLYLEDVKSKKPDLHIKLDAKEYVSGDTIRISMRTSSNTNDNVLIVNVRLYRILTFHDVNPLYPMEDLVRSSTTVLKDWKEDVLFRTNSDLTPTVDYSPIMRLSYRLQVKASIRRSQKSKNARLLLTWPSTFVFETPIVIGTLGSGLRVVDELSLYTFNSRPRSCPKFVKDVEHEDVLPKYEPSRLPCYSLESNRTRSGVTMT